MAVSPHVVSKGLHRMLDAPNKQDGAALVAYVLGRGYRWADSTSVDDALGALDDGRHLHNELGPALRRYLEMRRRLSGGGYSVADVERVWWWRRQVASWDELVYPSTAVVWPGSTAWRDLRLSHLWASGWTHQEIAGLLKLPTALVRRRFGVLSSSLAWRIVCTVDDAPHRISLGS